MSDESEMLRSWIVSGPASLFAAAEEIAKARHQDLSGFAVDLIREAVARSKSGDISVPPIFRVNPEQRLRRTKLAKAIGVGQWFVRGMVAAGFVMPGGTATVADAKNWLRKNPEFSATQAILKRGQELKKSSGAGRRGRPRAGADKCGESSSKHD